MGCDIHGPWIEVSEFPASKEPWYARCEWWTWRNYGLFGALAGVCSLDADTPTEPKGYPADIGYQWRKHHEQWGDDCHHASWLTADELAAAGEAYLEAFNETSHDIVAWLFVMRTIEESEGKAVRLGFCFDN